MRALVRCSFVGHPSKTDQETISLVQDAIAAREAVTQIICRYLCVLSADDVPSVARKALHWIVQRSSASSRVSNLLLVWRAAVDVDLTLWQRSQAEALAPEQLAAPPLAARPHGNALIELLEDPLIKMLRAGDAQVRCTQQYHPPQPRPRLCVCSLDASALLCSCETARPERSTAAAWQTT